MKRFGSAIALLLICGLWLACDAPSDRDDGSFGANGDYAARGGVKGQVVSVAADDDGGKQCEPTAPPAWPEADLADPSVISFDEQLFFTVDDQRFFPLGFYSVPTSLEGLQQFKSEGFNLALTGPGCCGGTSLQDQIDLLHRAQEAGVFIIFHPWTPADQVLTRPEEELEAELDARTGIGSLFGWYTFDEPGLWGTDPVLTGRMHEVLSTFDPTHMDGLVDAPVSDYNLYVDDCAFFMVDPYPSSWIPLSYIKAVMQEAKDATEGTKPIVGVMQAFSWAWYDGETDAEYHPNGLEMRNMAWQFIVHGASGLIPWNYGGDYTIRFQPEIWSSYLATIAEMNSIMSVILADNVTLDLAPETKFPTMFDYVVKEDETATWVFSVSTSERKLAVSLDFSTLGNPLCIVDYTTGEIFVQDGDGRVAIEYEPLHVRILEVIE